MGSVSASILGADLAHLADQVTAVEPFVSAFHIDIMDGHFVPPIALGTVVVASLRSVTKVRFHGHLMVDTPTQYFDELAEAGLDIVSFHLEAIPEPGPAIEKARGAGLGVGLTINLGTPVAAVAPYLEDIDDLMLMSIQPGWSGQVLHPEIYPRLEEARTAIDRAGLRVPLEIDGGVKVENAGAAVDAGATVLIAASGIFGQPDPADAAQQLSMIAEGA
ncbi:MAG: ribulose-phosphate 3-epimerase [Actinomycetota bacterium]